MESKLWHDIFVSLIVGVLFASGPVVTGWVLALLTNNPSLLENLYERASVFLWSVPVAIVFYLILLFLNGSV